MTMAAVIVVRVAVAAAALCLGWREGSEANRTWDDGGGQGADDLPQRLEAAEKPHHPGGE